MRRPRPASFSAGALPADSATTHAPERAGDVGALNARAPRSARTFAPSVRAVAPLTEEQRAALLAIFAQQWKVFAEFVPLNDPKATFPPDFIDVSGVGEQQVVTGIEGKASPTNIGAYMLMTMDAWDLGVITTDDEAIVRITRVLACIDKLPKYKGDVVGTDGVSRPVEQLYDWYSNTTLDLYWKDRRTVSAVDNANFAFQAVAVQSAFLEMKAKRPLSADQHAAVDAIIASLGRTLDLMRFDVFADTPTGPLCTAVDVNPDNTIKQSPTHYDLFLSEGRLAPAAGYLLGHLSDAQWKSQKTKLHAELNDIRRHPRAPMASWTATAMELFWPEVFFDTEGRYAAPGAGPSPLVDVLRKARAAQRAHRQGEVRTLVMDGRNVILPRPHGTSEGYVDKSTHVQQKYAGWGVPKMAHSTEYTAPTDTFIQPYAGQLMAPWEPALLLKNELRLKADGAWGRFGDAETVVYEADLNHAVPRYYPHHLAMGNAAIANALTGCNWRWTHASPYNAGDRLRPLYNTPLPEYAQPSRVPTQVTPANTPESYKPLGYDVKEIMGVAGAGAGITAYVSAQAQVQIWNGENEVISHNTRYWLNDGATLLPLQLETAALVENANGKKVFATTVTHPQGGELRVTLTLTTSATTAALVSSLGIENHTGRALDLAITQYQELARIAPSDVFAKRPQAANFVSTAFDDAAGAVTVRRTGDGVSAVFATPDVTAAHGSRGAFVGGGGLAAPDGVVGSSSTPRFGDTLDPAAVLTKAFHVGAAAGARAEVPFVALLARDGDDVPALVAQAVAESRSRVRIAGAPHMPTQESHAWMEEIARQDARIVAIQTEARIVGGGRTAGRPRGTGEGTVVLPNGNVLVRNPFALDIGTQNVVGSNMLERDEGKRFSALWGQMGDEFFSFGNAQWAGLVPPPDVRGGVPRIGLLVQDAATGERWSITPYPAPSDKGRYEVELALHSITYRFFGDDGVDYEVTKSVSSTDSVALWEVSVKNGGNKENVSVEAMSFFESAMGDSNQQHVLRWALKDAYNKGTRTRTYDAEHQALLTSSPGFLNPDAVGIHALVGAAAHENALFSAGTDGSGPNTAAGLSAVLSVNKGETRRLAFVSGAGATRADALALLDKYNTTSAVAVESARAKDDVDGLAVRLRTPNATLNRIFAGAPAVARRAHLGGVGPKQLAGKGGRDRIQTGTNLSMLPSCRAQAEDEILRACRNQAWIAEGAPENGRLLHWYHELPPSRLKNHVSPDITDADAAAAVRALPVSFGQLSRASDLPVWLAWGVLDYVQFTGDTSLLDKRTPYAQTRALADHEHDNCGLMPLSDRTDTVYEHAKAALDAALRNLGPNGIPLMGTGDWNDGLDHVGHLGRGESVWLGSFLHDALKRFADLALSRGDVDTGARYGESAAALSTALNTHAFLGTHYARAKDDAGRWLDIADAVEGWVVTSGVASAERGRAALRHVMQKLHDKGSNLVRLFEFEKLPEEDAGHAGLYLKGVREAGQYTHALLFLMRGLLEAGEIELAMEVLQAILPDDANLERYRGDLLALAADKNAGQFPGRAGWTWYTGATGWFFRVVLDSLLGVQIRGEQPPPGVVLASADEARQVLRFAPRIPTDWPGFDVSLPHGAARYDIHVENPLGVSSGVVRIVINGHDAPDALVHGVPFVDDGQVHTISVVMGIPPT